MSKKKKGSRYHQGVYESISPEKNINSGKIRYMSSWELAVMRWLDQNPNILKWGSEVIQIPYASSVKGRMARYYPDILMTYRNKDGEIKTTIVEIKPYAETQKPKRGPKQKQSSYDYQLLTFITNQEKWTAAQLYAKERGWDFRIITEREIFVA